MAGAATSLIGTLTTWRAAFALAAVFMVIAVAAQLAAVPQLGADGRVRPKSLLTVVTLPVSCIGLVAAGAIFFANFAAYTYIGPCCIPGPASASARSRSCC